MRLNYAIAAGLIFASCAHAGGISLYEIGSDDVALAAAGYSARAQDPSTIYTNPAGMTRLQGKQTFIGLQLLYEDLEFTPETVSPFLGSNDGGNPVNVLPGGSFFYNYSISEDFKAGIGIYGNFGALLKYDGDWIGRYTVVGATLLGASIQPTLAYRFSPHFSVGAGPIFMYGLFKDNTRINNTPFQLRTYSDGEVLLSDTTWGVGANVGILYEFTPETRFGLSYTSPIKLDFSPTAEFNSLSPAINTVLANRGLLNAEVDIGITVPQGAMASLFHQINDRWAILASGGWQNWKKFGEVSIEIDSNNPKSLTVNNNYKDTWHAAVGMQHHFAPKCLLNFGVGYDSRFQDPSQIPVSVPANSAWRFGIGPHFAKNEHLDLGLAFEYIYGGTLHVNSHGPIIGDIIGEYKHTGIYFLAVNANFKCL